MRKFLFFLFACCGFGAGLFAQNAGLNKNVNLRYERVRLGKALNEISHDYKVHFSYSRDFIPVGKRVSATVVDQPLSKALDQLFAPTKIIYAPIGDQIVLKVSAHKKIQRQKKEEPELTGSLDYRPAPRTTPVYQVPPVKRRTEVIRPASPLRTPSLEPVDWPEDFPTPEEEIMLVEPTKTKALILTNVGHKCQYGRSWVPI